MDMSLIRSLGNWEEQIEEMFQYSYSIEIEKAASLLSFKYNGFSLVDYRVEISNLDLLKDMSEIIDSPRNHNLKKK